MKKVLAILLLVCIICTMTACPGGEPPVVDPGNGGGGDNGGGNGDGGGNGGGGDNGDGGSVIPVQPTYAQTYPYTDEDGVLHIRYQDTYTFPNDIMEIRDIDITSTVTGTETPDSQLLVEKSDGKTVYADGCGSATVVFRGNRTTKVQVDPSPINLFFVTGQSNASGDRQSGLLPGYDAHYANDYIRSPETMAYYTFCGQQVSIDIEGDLALYQQAIDEDGKAIWHTAADVANNKKLPTFTDYHLNVPTTLDWETATVSMGCQPQQLTIPKGQTSVGNVGWNAALAYEWIQQTGERVWIVNCSQGGMEIQQFLPSEDGSVINNEYYQAVAVFNLALETLYKEVDAGHFTLNHMAYYWFHGESNSATGEIAAGEYTGWDNRFRASRGNRYLEAEEYTEYFTRMHQGFMNDVKYEHNGVTKELEYCGIMTVRTKKGENTNSFEQIVMTGARASQYYMGAAVEEALKNVYVVSNVTEQWLGETYDSATQMNPEADAAVEAYFLSVYGSAEKFEEIFGYPMPTTVYEMHPGVHYLMHGHNEMGMDCARNSLRIINITQPENCYKLSYTIQETAEIKLVGTDGRTELTDTILFDQNERAVICAQVTPLYRAVDGIEMEVLTPGFELDGYILKWLDPSYGTVAIKVSLGGVEYGTYVFTANHA